MINIKTSQLYTENIKQTSLFLSERYCFAIGPIQMLGPRSKNVPFETNTSGQNMQSEYFLTQVKYKKQGYLQAQ